MYFCLLATSISETTDWTSNVSCNYETYLALLFVLHIRKRCTLHIVIVGYAFEKVKKVNTENSRRFFHSFFLFFSLFFRSVPNLDFNQHFNRKTLYIESEWEGDWKCIEPQAPFPSDWRNSKESLRKYFEISSKWMICFSKNRIFVRHSRLFSRDSRGN